jgi:hypothetical protein
MVDVTRKRCIVCTSNYANQKYRKHCLRCFVQYFPDEKNARNYKNKEKAVADFLFDQFPSLSWTWDKRVVGGCSRFRPDFLVHLGDQVIIIEVDEDKHECYDTSCDNKRTMQLSQDLGFCPIVRIRFNPDKYDNNASCWSINSLGICVVSKKREHAWQKRLLVLKSTIEYYLEQENKSTKTIHDIHLFYDTTPN